VYAYTDKLTGSTSFDPLEDIVVEELRLKVDDHRRVKYRKVSIIVIF
jgi:hypothetical protein